MQGRGEFRVSVTKDYLVFASAHFITFAGHRCEGLHGHNYRARVTVEGALNKFLGEITLLGQPFVKDDKQTVEKMLAARKGKVNGYAFLVVGEGIEKAPQVH